MVKRFNAKRLTIFANTVDMVYRMCYNTIVISYGSYTHASAFYPIPFAESKNQPRN